MNSENNNTLMDGFALTAEKLLKKTSQDRQAIEAKIEKTFDNVNFYEDRIVALEENGASVDINGLSIKQDNNDKNTLYISYNGNLGPGTKLEGLTGTGGGGGGSSSASKTQITFTYDLAKYPSLGITTENSVYNLGFTWDSKYFGTTQSIPSGGANSYSIYVNGINVKNVNKDVNPGVQIVEDVGPYLEVNGTQGNKIYFEVIDSEGTIAQTLTFTVKVVSLTVTPPTGQLNNSTIYFYNNGQELIQSVYVNFQQTDKSITNKKLILKIDNQIIEEETITFANNATFKEATFKNLQRYMQHGSHTIEVAAQMTISGRLLESTNNVKQEIIFIDYINNEPSNQPIITFNIDENEKFLQYETYNLPYMVYKDNLDTVSATITIKQRGQTDIVKTQITEKKVISYIPLTVLSEETPITITIDVEDTQITRYIEVIPSSLDISSSTVGLALELSPIGRSNNDDNLNTWIDKVSGIECTLNNAFTFKNNNDGWITVNEENVLRLINNNYVTIPYDPFLLDNNDVSNDILAKNKGLTFEFEFSVFNIIDYNSTILECIDKNMGIKITAKDIGFFTQQSSSRYSYSEGDKIHVAIVTVPRGSSYSAKRPNTDLLKIYINGILSYTKIISSSDVCYHQTAKNIIIGSSACSLDVYSLRIYKNALSSQQVVRNWISNMQKVTERKKYYLNNEIYSEDSVIINDENPLNYEKLPINLPYMIIKPIVHDAAIVDEEFHLPTKKYTKDEQKTSNGVNIFYCDVSYYENNTIAKDSQGRTYYPNNFIARNATMEVQGTSSEGYYRKNLKLKFKTNNNDTSITKPKNFQGFEIRDGSKQLIEETDSSTGEQHLPLKYALRGKEYNEPVNTFVLKADVASSEGANNVELTRLYNDLEIVLGIKVPPRYAEYNKSVNDGKGTITNIDNVYLKTRSGIDGIPIALFINTGTDELPEIKFYGKMNFNLDKSTSETYGFKKGGKPTLNEETGEYVFPKFDEMWSTENNDSSNVLFKHKTKVRNTKNELGETVEEEYSDLDLNKSWTTETRLQWFGDGDKMGGDFENVAPDYDQPSTSGLISQRKDEILNKFNEPYYKNLQILIKNVADTEIFAGDENIQSTNPKYNGYTLEEEKMQEFMSLFYFDGEENTNPEKRIIDFNSAAFFYLFTEIFLMIDSRAKNMFPKRFGYSDSSAIPRWYFHAYDMDTSLGIDNLGQLTYTYDLEDIDNTISQQKTKNVNNLTLLESGKWLDETTNKTYIKDDDGYLVDVETGEYKIVDVYVPVYNGQSSVLWKNFRKVFYDNSGSKNKASTKLSQMYKTIRLFMNEDNINKRFDDHQQTWPENLINEDMYKKYIYTWERDINRWQEYIPMLQGTKKFQRKAWLKNRLRYLDCKYGLASIIGEGTTSESEELGTSYSNFISFRPNAGTDENGEELATEETNLNVSYYTTVYGGVYIENIGLTNGKTQTMPSEIKESEGIPKELNLQYYTVKLPPLTDTTCKFICADQIYSLGNNLNTLTCKLLSLNNARKINRLILGSENTTNNTLQTLSMGNTPSLEYLDLRRIAGSTLQGGNGLDSLNLSNCISLKTCLLQGDTNLTSLNLPETSSIEELRLPNTLKALSIVNQPNIRIFSMDDTYFDNAKSSSEYIENAQNDFSNLSTLILDNVNPEIIDTKNIILNHVGPGKNLNSIYFSNIEWTFNNEEELNSIVKLFEKDKDGNYLLSSAKSGFSRISGTMICENITYDTYKKVKDCFGDNVKLIYKYCKINANVKYLIKDNDSGTNKEFLSDKKILKIENLGYNNKTINLIYPDYISNINLYQDSLYNLYIYTDEKGQRWKPYFAGNWKDEEIENSIYAPTDDNSTNTFLQLTKNTTFVALYEKVQVFSATMVTPDFSKMGYNNDTFDNSLQDYKNYYNQYMGRFNSTHRYIYYGGKIGSQSLDYPRFDEDDIIDDYNAIIIDDYNATEIFETPQSFTTFDEESEEPIARYVNYDYSISTDNNIFIKVTGAGGIGDYQLKSDIWIMPLFQQYEIAKVQIIDNVNMNDGGTPGRNNLDTVTEYFAVNKEYLSSNNRLVDYLDYIKNNKSFYTINNSYAAKNENIEALYEFDHLEDSDGNVINLNNTICTDATKIYKYYIKYKKTPYYTVTFKDLNNSTDPHSLEIYRIKQGQCIDNDMIPTNYNNDFYYYTEDGNKKTHYLVTSNVVWQCQEHPGQQNDFGTPIISDKTYQLLYNLIDYYKVTVNYQNKGTSSYDKNISEFIKSGSNYTFSISKDYTYNNKIYVITENWSLQDGASASYTYNKDTGKLTVQNVKRSLIFYSNEEIYCKISYYNGINSSTPFYTTNVKSGEKIPYPGNIPSIPDSSYNIENENAVLGGFSQDKNNTHEYANFGKQIGEYIYQNTNMYTEWFDTSSSNIESKIWSNGKVSYIYWLNDNKTDAVLFSAGEKNNPSITINGNTTITRARMQSSVTELSLQTFSSCTNLATLKLSPLLDTICGDYSIDSNGKITRTVNSEKGPLYYTPKLTTIDLTYIDQLKTLNGKSCILYNVGLNKNTIINFINKCGLSSLGTDNSFSTGKMGDTITIDSKSLRYINQCTFHKIPNIIVNYQGSTKYSTQYESLSEHGNITFNFNNYSGTVYFSGTSIRSGTPDATFTFKNMNISSNLTKDEIKNILSSRITFSSSIKNAFTSGGNSASTSNITFKFDNASIASAAYSLWGDQLIIKAGDTQITS